MLSSPARAGNVWAQAAEELALWTWERCVNRADIWGAYIPHNGPITCPAVAQRGQRYLSPELLARHYRATGPEHIVGLHSTSTSNLSRWGAVDIDQHGETSTPAALNFAAALHWYERLRGLGFTPLLTDSNGAGGFHLRVLFSESIPTPRVFAFLRQLVADHAERGIPNAPEIFPKQPLVSPGRCGNWLRLPGRHHSRDHWARIWNGAQWVNDPAFALTLTGDDPARIPADAVTLRARVIAPAPLPRPASADRQGRRIVAYMARLPTGLGAGQQRDCHAFRFAAFLSRDLGLVDSAALSWLGEWDARQAEAKGAERLQIILANAKRYAKHSVAMGHT
jgi:putative DNA primase/helicase